jgi:hypothetical protein
LTVSEILIAFFLSFGISMLISLIAHKATDISYTPGDETKAAEELVKQMKECDELARSFEQIGGNAILNDYDRKWQDGVMRLSSVTEPLKTVLMYHGEEISLEKARLLQKDGIGFVADWAEPLRTVKLSDHPHRCKCAYCDTLNDHETGVCDRCGAPLL